MIFKLTDVTVSSSCKGRLQKLYSGPNSDDSILPVALTCFQEKLFVANGHAEQPCILVLHGNKGVLLRRIISSLLSSPCGLCLVDTHLFVAISNHCIIKLPILAVPMRMWNCTVENQKSREIRMVSLLKQSFTPPMALRTWVQL